MGRGLSLGVAVCAVLFGMSAAAAAGEPTEPPTYLEPRVRPDVRMDTPSGRPVPRFVSLKARAFGRIGPSFDHAIKWELQRIGAPLEVVAEDLHWRKVRDPFGDEMWVFHTKLDGRRRALVRPVDGATLHKKPASDETVVLVEQGVILRLLTCEGAWCKVRGGGHAGWIERQALWGVYADEPSAPSADIAAH